MTCAQSRCVVSLVLLVLADALFPSATLAQFTPMAPSEYDLKAAFVYQFLSYVSWPGGVATANDVLVVGVVGAPELGNNLAILAGDQAATSRPVDVRIVGPDVDVRDLDVLFVAASSAARTDALLQSAVENGVLTITETLPRPAHSVINFEVIDNRVRFDVALGLARQNGLDVSGRLLQVALRVIEAP